MQSVGLRSFMVTPSIEIAHGSIDFAHEIILNAFYDEKVGLLINILPRNRTVRLRLDALLATVSISISGSLKGHGTSL